MTVINFNFTWTAEIDERLKVLALSGLSARQCRDKLFDERLIWPSVTRNAVIGHARRIGLSFGGGKLLPPLTTEAKSAELARKQRWREKRRAERIAAGWVSRKKAVASFRPVRKAASPRRQSVANVEPLARPVREAPPLVGGAGIRFEALRGSAGVEGSSCRWPFGDPLDFEDLRFCPETVARGSYCVAHGALAYVRPNRINDGKGAGK